MANQDNNFAAMRQAVGLTQKEVADMAGISIKTYQKYEYNIRPISKAAADTALLIARAFGVTVEELLSE